MAFYLIGLGLGIDSLSAAAIKKLNVCDKVYLESYTVNFPYDIKDLESEYNLSIIKLDRSRTEDESILKEAKEKNIALLVYGDSLSATTHMQLVLECKKQNISYEIFPNASILTAVARTGLSPYKFGKTASMPNWNEHTNRPTSFTDYIKENESVGAHSLILTDIGLTLNDSLKQLEESGVNPEKVIVFSNAGTSNEKIFFDTPANLKGCEVKLPFCLIIPSKLHFLESEALDSLKSSL